MILCSWGFKQNQLSLSLSLFLGASYCLCRDGVGEKDLQTSIDYACGVLKDCNPIHEKGPCYQPNTIKSHCDWAVNTYFQRFGQISGSCNFSGTASTSQNLPSSKNQNLWNLNFLVLWCNLFDVFLCSFAAVVTGCIYPSSPGYVCFKIW